MKRGCQRIYELILGVDVLFDPCDNVFRGGSGSEYSLDALGFQVGNIFVRNNSPPENLYVVGFLFLEEFDDPQKQVPMR
jgi:hypothetical protein